MKKRSRKQSQPVSRPLPPSPDTAFLIEAEAASVLRLRPQTLANWRVRGEGPAFSKVGRRVLYLREALDAFVRSRQRTATTT